MRKKYRSIFCQSEFESCHAERRKKTRSLREWKSLREHAGGCCRITRPCKPSVSPSRNVSLGFSCAGPGGNP
ncbi:hypothetical protein GBAR_LOCUS9854 [Geodia barretti]|uniref:Uncharacterized protein n=1 Tax=Geodia barretti TaxID=519541 RepID=A0AA35WJF2_GEOBA|nr:hypothetical protein GBAR_LOCUS9854 [Geodia barretti]